MKNPFKRKYRVCIDEVINHLIEIIRTDRTGMRMHLYDWIELKYGVKRIWSWKDQKNYLVFDSEHDYTMFLLKL
jgi:hypothetical protein